MSGKYDDLEKLRDLFSKGIITETEFNIEKEKILNGSPETEPIVQEQVVVTDPNNGFCSLMHLSRFSNYVLPGIGFIVPIIMWATRKDQSRAVDVNGKIIFNWLISSFIYSCLLVLLLVIVALVFGSSMFLSGMDFGTGAYNGNFEESPLAVFRLLGTLGTVIIPLITIGILDFIFTIIGAIKAGKGEVWNYPFSIRFFNTK